MPTETKGVANIVLSKWIPALITAGIGGLIVALLVPSIQAGYAEKSAMNDRKIELWESIGDDFTNYILNRGRLITVAKEEEKALLNDEKLDEAFYDRKEGYRKERDKCSAKLRLDFLLAEFYFSERTNKMVDEFLKWHQEFRIATIDILPPSSKYYEWRDKIMASILLDLGKGA